MELTVARAQTPGQAVAVKEHCELYHYLHRYPDPRSLPFGYVLHVDGAERAEDGRLHGLIVMKKPQHLKQRKLFGYKGLPTAWQVLDLARVWIHPALQGHVDGHARCVFSQFVSRVIRRVQWDWLDHHPPRYPSEPYHIEVIISYCDLNHHDGTAYRASGFKWNGYSEKKTKEVYYRLLHKPFKSWQPTRPAQPPLFGNLGLPLRHD